MIRAENALISIWIERPLFKEGGFFIFLRLKQKNTLEVRFKMMAPTKKSCSNFPNPVSKRLAKDFVERFNVAQF